MDRLQESQIPILILLGSLGMLLLVGGIAAFILAYQRRMLLERKMRAEAELQHQSKMIKRQLESVEKERKRIGADLHDSLGSLLWGAKVNVSFLRTTGSKKDLLNESFDELNQILDDSISVVRRIAWELAPDAFHYSGLSESLLKLCKRMNGKGMEVCFVEENVKKIWNDERALHVFRIAQELVSNSIKHSKGTVLTVHLKWNDKWLFLSIIDDGQGFDSTSSGGGGIGLWNVYQRINQLQGKISRVSIPSMKGVNFAIEIPLDL